MTKPIHGLSTRARDAILHTKQAPYVTAHLERLTATPRDPDYLCLAIAENHLMWDLISEKANAVRNVARTAFTYEDMLGSVAFRTAVAGFLSDRLFAHPVDPGSIVAFAGAGAVVEALTWTLVDPGGSVVIPTPSYSGYWNDIESRAGVHAVPAHTRYEDDFRISPDALSAAAEGAPGPAGALLLTNPSNPLGRMLTEDEVRGAVAWARERDLPVIMNEVYGSSIHGDARFRSAVELFGGIPDDVHFVWALSKDFASSGLRCGVAITTNETVHESLMHLVYFAAVSGDTQHLVTTMLGDDEWTSRYLTSLRSRLRTSYDAAREALSVHGISAISGDAGIFMLADLRAYLDAPTWEAEDRLWRRILDGANVNLTPGSACRIAEPGFMRICYASASPSMVREGLGRVASTLDR